MRQLPWILLFVMLVGIAAVLFLRDPADPEPEAAPPAQAPALGEAAPEGRAREATLEGAPDAKPESTATPEPAREPEISPQGTWKLTGRVLDERRRPVAGANVRTLGFAKGATGSTTAEGRFHLYAEDPTQAKHAVGVLARHADGRSAWGHVPTAVNDTGRADVGDLILKATAPLAVEVVAPDGAPAAGARVVLEGVERGTALPVAESTADAEGRTVFPTVSPGYWRVYAVREGLGRGQALLDLRRERPDLVRVTLSPPHALAVTVIDAETEEPIENATVTVLEYFRLGGRAGVVTPYRPTPAIEPTSASGLTTIHGLGREDRVQVHAEADGYPRGLPLSTSQHGLEPGRSEATVKLTRVRSITWPLADDGSPVPPAGSVFELASDPSAVQSRLPPSVRIENGAIVGDGFERHPIHAFALAPDGRYARLFCRHDTDEGHETSFIDKREVIVIARYPDGSPARGYFVHARSQGNNVLAPPAPLGDDGRAVLRLLFAWRVDVFLSTSRAPYGGKAIGTLDLKEEGGTLEAEVPYGRPVVLAVEVAGKRRLPEAYRLYAGGDPVADVEEDPEMAELRFTAHPAEDPASRSIILQAPGYEAGHAELALEGEAGPLRAHVSLLQACGLVARIGLPQGGKATLRLQIWDPEKGTWRPDYRNYNVSVRAEEDTSEGVHRFEGLAAGRYRLLDPATGTTSAEIELRSGVETKLAWELTAVAVVRGRVELPEGWIPQEVRIRVDGLPSTNPGIPAWGINVRHDGSFAFETPVGTSVTLRPYHPLLRPAEGSAEVTVRSPKHDLVFTFVVGPVLRLRWPGSVPEGRDAPPRSIHLVLSQAGERIGLFEARRMQDADVWIVGGFAAGTYDARLDVRGYAPTTIARLEIGEGETDLTLPALSRGTTLRIHVRAKDGQDPPRVYAGVRSLEGEPYNRGVNSNGEAEVLLPGLGPGRFRLQVHLMRDGFGGAGGKTRIDREIEVDGTSDMEFDLDLRE